jgi:predicted acylesterase/phospholipase RssA
MKYDTVCLSGGGIFGFTFIGAIYELINNNLLDINNITTWIGTSAGAIISFIFALG